MKYKLIDIATADMAFHAYGRTLEELFSNSALAMFSIIGNPGKDEVSVDVKTEADDLESLLVNWLNELLFIFDTSQILFSRFEVKIRRNERYKLSGKARGEGIKPEHDLKAYVKAATYHLLEIKKENDHWRAQVVVDL